MTDNRGYLKKYHFDERQFEELKNNFISGKFSEKDNVIAGRVETPADNYFCNTETLGNELQKKYRETGGRAIRQGGLGVVIVNGGMATRFGGIVKGAVEVFDGKTFLQLKIEQVKAVNKRYSVNIPVYIMNSFSTEQATVELFKKNNFFGMSENNIHFFNQYIFKRLNPDGSEFMTGSFSGNMQDQFSAPGHGDFIFAFKGEGFPDRFIGAGGKYIWYSNVDNLGATIDEVILGYHIESGAEMLAEVARKEPGDKGGAPAMVNGKLQIVEGFMFPPEFDQDNINVFNTATCIFSAEALLKNVILPWYAVKKDVGGKKIIQFERLTGDLSKFLNTKFIVVDRGKRFIPIKTPHDLEQQRDSLRKKFSGTPLTSF
ncbi:MAG: UTP--glucose-1-phosphate uridylyltransferase [Elusimicrobia bacterium]|nr:UTP--glucose-1-phosphate uridylyltransferase [Elusimicrobiota bacterium]